MLQYVETIRDNIISDGSELKRLRLKKGTYKKYLEEFLPLVEFSKIRYAINADLTFKLVEGNQSFDAQVMKNDEIIRKIEFTYPRDGNQENSEALKLNSAGFANISIDENIVTEYLEQIFLAASKKSKKDYGNAIVVIHIVPHWIMDLGNPRDRRKIQDLVYRLGTIAYNAAEVVLQISSAKYNDGSFSTEIHSVFQRQE